MPFLKKAKNKSRIKRIKEDKNKDIYNSKKWKTLRNYYIKNHPLCYICELKGVAKIAEDVHHIDSFSRYIGDERIEKAFDINNLMTLCKYHHSQLHLNHHSPSSFDFEEYKKQHPNEFNN